jgi:hypothetical protein
MSQGFVLMLVMDPATGEYVEETMTIVMKSKDPIKLAQQQTGKFANGMKDWGKTRKAFGQSIIDRGLTLVMKPVII